MDMGKVEQLRDEVIGIRPVYSEIGNATDILLKDGRVVRDRRVLNSVVKALAASYAVDLKAQRRNLREKLGRKGVLPFYLGEGRVFVPLKMRQAITDGDSVYGYLDMSYMGQPRAGTSRECLIPLANGLELQVLSAQSTILGIQNTGQALLSALQPDKGDGDVREEQVKEATRVLAAALVEILEQLKRIEYSLK
ncbi:MAG: hypothetical protein PHP26_08810 [Syntrophomonas sp.]|nr:hypothetical protein [Syntrophomonas sp.]